jgi:hypothetical protein
LPPQSSPLWYEKGMRVDMRAETLGNTSPEKP